MAGFYELIIEGDEHEIRGFVEGCLVGAGRAGETWYLAADYGVRHDSAMREAAEALHVVENISHVIASEAAAGVIGAALEQEDKAEIELKEMRGIAAGQVEFSWKVYSRDGAAEIRAIVESRPASISIEGYEPEEEIHEDDRGETGMYAPSHAYTASASGVAHGPAGDLIEWAARLREHQFVQVEDICLQYVEGGTA